MFSQFIKRPLLILAIAATGLFALSACEGSGDVAAPIVQEEAIQAADLGLPSTSAMVASVGADAGQETSIRKARSRWEHADFDSGPHPLHGFLSELSTSLEQDQMLALVNLIAQTQAEQAGGRRGAYGADGGRQGRGHGQRDGVLEHADELDLSEEQIAAIAALMEDFRAAMRELMGEGERGGRPTDEQRAQMQVLREAHITSVLEVLTEDQRIALEEIRAEQRESRHNERAAKHENRAAQTLEFLSTMLNLSDGQQEQIQAVVQAQQQKMQALNEEFHNAQSGERPSVEARTAHREAVQELRAEGRAAIVELLDEQQAELFEALGKLRQNGQHGQRDGRPPHGRS